MEVPLILLIDDEANILYGLKLIITRAGYRVITASNGAEGYQAAVENTPDLIISDVMMPPPNGFDLRRKLTQNTKTAAIPFIFLTARSAQGDKNFGLELGSDDYITKPFDRQELISRVQAVLRRTYHPS